MESAFIGLNVIAATLLGIALGLGPALGVRIGHGQLCRQRITVLRVVAVFVFILPPLAFAQTQPALTTTRKLSAISATGGTLQDLKVAGSYAVYLADYDVEGRFDLYSVLLAGGPATRLTASLSEGRIDAFELTSAGLVLFSTYEDWAAPNGRHLFAVPAAGGALTRLGPNYPEPAPLNPGGTGLSFAVSSDGAYVVYSADVVGRGLFELFSAPIAGGDPIRLSPPLPDPLPLGWGPSVSSFQLSPDGQHAVFSSYDAATTTSTLYAVPLTGGAAPHELAVGTFFNFALSPDSQVVAFSEAEFLFSYTSVLRSVPLVGGSPVDLATLEGELTFAFTADSQRIVYHGREIDGTTELLASVPVTGCVLPTRLAAPDEGFGFGPKFVLAPDGQTVFYTRANAAGLFRTSVSGGPEQAAYADMWVDLSSLVFTADGQYAVFLAGYQPFTNLYSYPLAGGLAVLIGEQVNSAAMPMPMPLGAKIAFVSSVFDPTTYKLTEKLYAASAASGAATVLTGGLDPDAQRICLLGVSLDGIIIFTSSTTPPGMASWRELYAVPHDGSATPQLLDQSRAIAGDVRSFVVSPLDGRVVYLADQELDERPDLYSVPLSGGTPVKLNAADEQVWQFFVSPRGGRVLFSASPDWFNQHLYSVPIVGGPVSQIGAAGEFSPSEYRFTPDGAQFVFANYGGMQGYGLYRAPTTGGPASLIDFDGHGLQVSPDSARVVYMSNSETVRSAPLSGGLPIILGYGTAPIVSPDSTRVIFLRRSDDGSLGSLVSVPITGGEPRLLLPEAGFFVLNGFTPDGARVLITTFTCDLFNSSITEKLRVVALDGSGAVTLAESASIGGFICPSIWAQLTPRGDRAIVGLRQTTPAGIPRIDLLSAPVSGDASTVLFSLTDAVGSAPALALSPDGAQVLLRAGEALYRVQTEDGSATRLSAGGPTGAFAFAEDGSALFVEGGAIFHAPAAAPAVRVDDLPAGTLADSLQSVGRTVVFSAVTGAEPNNPFVGTSELYATDIALAPPLGGLAAAAPYLVEGAGSGAVEVQLEWASSELVQVGYRVTGGTAVAGVDYVLGAGPLSFGSGETVKALPLSILERPGLQGRRTLVITIEAPVLASAAPARPTTMTLIIVDNEFGLFLPLIRR